MRRGVAWTLLVIGVLFLVTAFYALLAGAAFVAIWFGALGLATGVIGERGLKAEKPQPAPAFAPRAGPVPLATPEALASVPEPIVACPECGFLGVRPGTLQDGTFAGGGILLSQRVCPRCGYQGIPLEFGRREDYHAFLQDLHAARAGPG